MNSLKIVNHFDLSGSYFNPPNAWRKMILEYRKEKGIKINEARIIEAIKTHSGASVKTNSPIPMAAIIATLNP